MSDRWRVRVALPSVAAALLVLAASPGTVGAREAMASAVPDPSEFCAPAVEFDPGNFSDPTTIDNPWFPLVPGTQRVLEGDVVGSPHQVVFTVTDLTKVIDGVRALAVWDVDISEGVVAEAELAFFAQDDFGNVWNLGEYPEEFEGGVFIGAPSTWFSGLSDAVGGIHMLGDPRPWSAWYLQGFAPDIEFLDCARITSMNQDVCPPYACFEDALLTKEKSPLDQGGGAQLKYHGQGIGIVQIAAVGDPNAETLALTSFTHMSPDAMAEARTAALALEARGYQVSDVYQQTPPLEQLTSASADLSIEKSASVDPARVGTPFDYTLEVSNSGPGGASNVVVTDQLPPTVTFRSAASSVGSCAQSGGTVTCSLGSLASGSSATVEIEVRPNATGSVTNTASVSSATADSDTSDNVDSETTTVRRRARTDLAVRIDDQPDPARVGRRLVYEITVRNFGEVTATDVTLLDQLPGSASFVSAAADQGSCSQAGGTVTCDLGSLAAGGSIEVEIVVRPAAAGTLANTADVSANEADPHSANNHDTETTGVL